MTTSEQTNAALRCPTCGGNIVFDPEAQQFRCASCGSIQKVTPGKDTVEEYDFAEYREREGRRMLENGETALRCDVCGAEFFQPAEGTATVCPMCGSPQIKPEEEHNGIPVEGVVPFAIDRYEAQKRFGQWIRKRWFAPASLKRTFAEGELVGMYVPFWTYDADAVTQYCGRGGRTYTLRGWDGENQVLLTNVMYQEQRVISEGPVRAIVEVVDNGWTPAPGLKPVNATIRYTIYAGHRDFDVDVFFNKDVSDYQFATGLINVKGSSEYTDGKGLRGCYGSDWPTGKDDGKHKLETVGLGIYVPQAALVKEMPANKDCYTQVVRPSGNKLSYKLAYTSANETYGFKSEKEWYRWLKDWKKLNEEPVQVYYNIR